MAIPIPNVSKPRQWLWGSTFLLLGVAMLIWEAIFQVGRLWAVIGGIVIILCMGLYAEYMVYREWREREGPTISSRAERRRALRRRRRAHSQPDKK
jgi:hypothetical protein